MLIPEYYIGRDLALAAFLMIDFPIVKMEKEGSNPIRSNFVFERTVKLDKAITDFYNNDARVSPQTYFNSLKNLKSRVYSL